MRVRATASSRTSADSSTSKISENGRNPRWWDTVKEQAEDVDTVTYELDRLYTYLEEYERTPGLQDQVIGLVDYAAWEQLATSIRGLRSTIRNVQGQVRGK